MLFVTVVLFAGAVEAAHWARIYGGAGDDFANAIEITADGGFIVAGSTPSGAVGAWLLRLDAGGSMLWQKKYAGYSGVNAVQPTADGGYVVAGSAYVTNPDGAWHSDAWLLKADAVGNVSWQRSYGGPKDDVAVSLRIAADGGYVVLGTTQSFGAGGSDAWVLKLDPGGNVLWQQTYGGLGFDYARSIEATADGGYVVAGSSIPSGGGAEYAWVLKLDTYGGIVWQKAFGSTRSDERFLANDVQPTADGGFIVAGYVSTGGSRGDAWLLRIDAAGSVVWQRAYGGSRVETAESVRVTTDGGYVVAGSADSFGAGESDAWVLKLDDAGAVLWQNTFGGSAGDIAHSVRRTADGGYVVAGVSYKPIQYGDADALVLKLDAFGSIAGCTSAHSSRVTPIVTNARVSNGTATAAASGATTTSTAFPVGDGAATALQVCYNTSDTAQVVEYYHTSLDHYFITWLPVEIAVLDAGTQIRGWARTGYSIETYTTARAGTSPVCRYYIPPGLGDSHFFGRGTSECVATGQKNPSFVLEDPQFMETILPTAGACPAGTTPVYRVFSNRMDANHRYTTDRAVRDAMVANGWLAEGDGPDLVVMCAPR